MQYLIVKVNHKRSQQTGNWSKTQSRQSKQCCPEHKQTEKSWERTRNPKSRRMSTGNKGLGKAELTHATLSNE